MYVELQVDNKRSNVKRLVIRERAVIGRQSHCDIRVVSNEISREHCQLEIRPEGAMLTDLGSTNGTYLNRKRVESHLAVLLQDGDQILVGPAGFTVHVIESAGEAAQRDPADETLSPLNTSGMETLVQNPRPDVSMIDEIDGADESENDSDEGPTSDEQFLATEALPSEAELDETEESDADMNSFLAGVASDNDLQIMSEDDAFEKYLRDL